MKTLLLRTAHALHALLAVLLFAAAGWAQAASYTFRSDTYSWESTSTTITWDRLCTGYQGDDDQATIAFTGGFTFSFAGTAYSSVRVLSNGALQFGADTGFMRTYTNTALPAGTSGAASGCTNAATARTMMIYWTDLNPSANGSGGVTWQQKGAAPNRYLVVSWNSVYQYNTSTPYTFQVILYENGEFKYQYGNSNASGSNATIGVQVSNSDYTQYSYNSGYNANGVAIRWVVPSTTAARVAEYRLDENSYNGTVGEVLDTSGNGHGGVRVGSAASTAGGYVCRALDIPANTSTSSSAVDTLINVTSGIGSKGSISLWYRSNVAWSSSTAAMIADAATAGSKPFNLMRVGGGALKLTVSDSAGATLSLSSSNQTFSAGTWVHVAATWQLAAGLNQTVLRLYVNGVLSGVSFGSSSGALDPALSTLFLGDNRSTNVTSGTLNSANGQLDEVRIYNFEATAADIASDMSNTHTCVPPVDHYELSLPSSAVSCVGSTVTVNACADSSSPCTNRSTALAGQTAVLSASGAAAVTPLVSFDATGTATATLSYPTATDNTVVTVTLSGELTAASSPRQCCPDGVACATANSCSITFKTAGFVIAASAGGSSATVPTQTAGTTSAGWFLRAVKTNSSSQSCEAAVTGSSTVDWAYQCQNPTTCNGNRMSLTGNATSTIAGNPSTGVVSTTTLGMTFDSNGNAPFSFNYADVGLVNFVVQKASSGSLLTPLAGRSNNFVVKPAGFALSAVQQTAAPNLVNPAASSASGARFLKAGDAFSATITALTSSGATAPSFGRETTPEGVLLTPTLVLPSGGSSGSISNATVAGGSFSAGVATVTNLAYSEVGIITLTPSVASGSYLGAGAVSGTASGNVGRFVPAKFALSAGSVTPRSALSCSPASSFGYLGENFRLAFTLTAQNLSGGTTTNYSGSFAKLDPTAASGWNLAGVDGSTAFTVAGGRLSLGSATGSWSNGVATGITLTANAVRAAAPEGPFSVSFGVAPTDSDGVSMGSFDMAVVTPGVNDRSTISTLALRFGRLRLMNAIGAADRTLSLPVQAQHWGGSAWAINTLDNCTSIATSAVSTGNLRRTLVAADASASAGISIVSGSGTLRLAAPSGGRWGSYDVALSLGATATDASCLQGWTPTGAASAGGNLSYLRGAWCGSTYDKDPSARATFGLQRGNDNLIYRREQF